MWGRVRMDGVIPLAVKGVRRDPDRGQGFVRDLDVRGIAARVALGVDPQPLLGGGGADQVDDDLMALQRTPPPVQADVGKEAMLDLVPLARPRWQMTDGDRQARFRGPPPDLVLPEPDTIAIAPATISAEQQLARRGIHRRAFTAPPAAQTFDRKARGVMIL